MYGTEFNLGPVLLYSKRDYFNRTAAVQGCIPNHDQGKSFLEMLYLLRFTVEYRGLSQPELLKVWVKEAQVALAAREQGMIRELWKVSPHLQCFPLPEKIKGSN